LECASPACAFSRGKPCLPPSAAARSPAPQPRALCLAINASPRDGRCAGTPSERRALGCDAGAFAPYEGCSLECASPACRQALQRVRQRPNRAHFASRSTRLPATDGASARRQSGARSGATPERSHHMRGAPWSAQALLAPSPAASPACRPPAPSRASLARARRGW
jgi:hypothetical protein